MPPIFEESNARRGDLTEVEILTLVEELEVNEVASTFTALTRNSVELLCDLVVCAHHRHGLRRFETDLGEEPRHVICELELGLVGATE